MILETEELLAEIEAQRARSRKLVAQARCAIQKSRQLIEQSQELMKLSEGLPDGHLCSICGDGRDISKKRGTDFD